jgi:protocatechuate 3,4-dioxygenase beta subunit
VNGPRRVTTAWLGAGLLGGLGLVNPVAAEQAPTTPTSLGVYYQPDAPERATLWQPGEPGQRLELRGRVVTTHGAPLAGARLEIWHADATGSVDESRYRATLTSAPDGSFTLRTVLPGHLDPQWNNTPWGPRHIHVMVTPADGRAPLVTRIYFKGDDRLEGMRYPELAIALEEARVGPETVLLGRVELVLR